jgi:hypothetical protein
VRAGLGGHPSLEVAPGRDRRLRADLARERAGQPAVGLQGLDQRAYEPGGRGRRVLAQKTTTSPRASGAQVAGLAVVEGSGRHADHAGAVALRISADPSRDPLSTAGVSSRPPGPARRGPRPGRKVAGSVLHGTTTVAREQLRGGPRRHGRPNVARAGRSPSGQRGIQRLQAERSGGDGDLRHRLAPAGQLAALGDVLERLSKGSHVSREYEQAGVAVGHELGQAADGRGHDRNARGQGLEDGQRAVLPPDGGQDEDVDRRKHAGLLALGERAVEADARVALRGAPEVVHVRGMRGQAAVQIQREVRAPQLPEGAHQDVHALVRSEGADEADAAAGTGPSGRGGAGHRAQGRTCTLDGSTPSSIARSRAKAGARAGGRRGRPPRAAAARRSMPAPDPPGARRRRQASPFSTVRGARAWSRCSWAPGPASRRRRQALEQGTR